MDACPYELRHKFCLAVVDRVVKRGVAIITCEFKQKQNSQFHLISNSCKEEQCLNYGTHFIRRHRATISVSIKPLILDTSIHSSQIIFMAPSVSPIRRVVSDVWWKCRPSHINIGPLSISDIRRLTISSSRVFTIRRKLLSFVDWLPVIWPSSPIESRISFEENLKIDIS